MHNNKFVFIRFNSCLKKTNNERQRVQTFFSEIFTILVFPNKKIRILVNRYFVVLRLKTSVVKY